MKSLRSKTALGIAGMLCLLLGSAAAEEQKEFSADVSVGYFSKYVWRGQNINNSSVLQPSVSGSAYGFTGEIWANIDLTNGSQSTPGNSGEFSEVDYALDYSAAFPGTDKMQFSLGVIHYLFPNTSFGSTTEIYGALAADVILSPSITWYRDINAVDGSYVQVAAGHTFEKVGKWSDDYHVGLNIDGSIAWAGAGYNRGYFDIDAIKFNDFTLHVGVPFELKSVSITPSLNFSTMVNSQVGKAAYKRNNAWFGIELLKRF